MDFKGVAACLLFASMLSASKAATANITFECPQGWDMLGTHCYNFVAVPLDFEDARDVCKKYGADLMMVRDEVEAREVSEMARGKLSLPTMTGHYWILNGGDENDTDNSLQETKCKGYWQPNEPMIDMTEKQAVASNAMGMWALQWYWMDLPFVCRTPACPKGSFRCSDGMCINSKWKCDGVYDCSDYSDENECPDCMKYNKQSSGSIDVSDLSEYCQWIIEGNPGEVLSLEIEELHIEDYIDRVRVYAGGPSIMTSTLLREIRMSVTSSMTLYSNNHYLIVVLDSGTTESEASLKATWKPDPELARGKTIELAVTANFQTLTSPYSDSDNIPTSFKRSWKLTAPEGELIVMEVTENTFDFDLRSSDDKLSEVSSDAFTLWEPNTKRGIFISNKNEMFVVVKTRNEEEQEFEARVRTGCDFNTSLNFATLRFEDFPPDINCSWTIQNQLDTAFSIAMDFNFVDDNDELVVYSGTGMSMGSVFTANKSSENPKKLQGLKNGVTFQYMSDIVLPDNTFSASIFADCPAFHNMDNLKYVEAPREAGSEYSVSLSCDEGYAFKQEEYNGTVQAKCTSRGMWYWGDPSYTRYPECQVVYCGVPQPIENGYVHNLSGPVIYNATATYKCYEGFIIEGSDTVTCQANGMWSLAPKCQAENCRGIPELQNGSYNITVGNKNLTQGTIISYSCDPGYDLQGVQTIVCKKNSTWSNDAPTCTKLKCSLPEIENGGYGDGNLPSFQDRVTLRCDEGYYINRTKTNMTTLNCTDERTLEFTNDTCVDIDECEGTNTCSSTQDCINNEGSYTCVCKPGYAGDPCININECAEYLDECDQGCEDTEGSYICKCDEGFTLYTENGTNGFVIPMEEDGTKPGDIYHINYTCVRNICSSKPEAPLNGMVLTNHARFQFNDTVNVACDFGFKLEGSSFATCGSNGNWSFEVTPTCTMLTCEQPSPVGDLEMRRFPANGTIEPGASLIIECDTDDGSATTRNRTLFCVPDPDNVDQFILKGDDPKCPPVDCGDPSSLGIPGAGMTTSDTTYGSSFVFSCDTANGFRLVGESSLGNTNVTCGSNGRWGFNNLTCEGLRCDDPGTKAGTKQVLITSYAIGERVNYTCTESGYSPTPTDSLICEYQNGTAVWNGEPPECVDTEQPTVTCPTLEPFGLYEKLVYTMPTEEDNSGFSCVTLQSGPPSNVAVVPKDITVTYEAKDRNNNTDYCSFNVTLKDLTAPTIECHDQFLNLTSGSTKELTLDASLLVNSSGDGDITFNPVGPLTLKAGDVVPVRARITKDNGLYKECAFLVYADPTTCESSSVPDIGNGLKVCSGDINALSCNVTCNDGYMYQDKMMQKTYTCDKGIWSTVFPLQPCLELQTPQFVFDVKLKYKTGTLSGTFNDSSCINSYNTQLEALIKALNKCGYTFEISFGSNTRSGAILRDVTFKLSVQTEDSLDKLEGCAEDLLNDRLKLFGPVNFTGVTQTCYAPWYLSNDTGDYIKATDFSCGLRSQLINVTDGNMFCLPCGKGMFYTDSTKTCNQCPDGEYQDKEGQTSCNPCPDMSKMSHLPRTSLEHCYKPCPKGFNSSTGYLESKECSPCPENTYSKDFPDGCQACASSASTQGVSAAENSSQCIEQCPAGQYSLSGYLPCLPCPVHFYSAKGDSRCTECGSHEYTLSNGTTDEQGCLTNATGRCMDFCNAVGTDNNMCEIIDHRPQCTCKAGYYGDKCDTVCNVCDPNPCFNGGECIPDGDTFTCNCKSGESCDFVNDDTIGILVYDGDINFVAVTNASECEHKCYQDTKCAAYLVNRETPDIYCFMYSYGNVPRTPPPDTVIESKKKNCSYTPLFSGDRCEVDEVDDCTDDICTERQFCMDLVGDTQCVCPPDGGYDDKCRKPDNLCATNPCKNEGTCESFGTVRYVCTCKPGYTGPLCDIDINECDLNPLGCLYEGTCNNEIDKYSCDCKPGFGGNHCEEKADLCKDNKCTDGLCTGDYYALTANCTCEGSYMQASPDECQKIDFCESNPCQNNASCSSKDDSFGCACLEGYEGIMCQHNTDDCAGSPCMNGGSCTDLVNGYTCDCPVGFTGQNCDENINDCISIVCEHGGKCEDKVNDYSCICTTGYTGKNCSENIDECSELEPCLHGGNCTDTDGSYTCQCEPGWTGNNCEKAEDYCGSKDPCQNDGICHNLQTASYCQCLSGTAGVYCESTNDLCGKFANNLCTSNGNCNSTSGTATCECKGAQRSCQMVPELVKFIDDQRFGEEYNTTVDKCNTNCLDNPECNAYYFAYGACFLFKTLVKTDRVEEIGAVTKRKDCIYDPYYTGVSCELEKNHCATNVCNGGMCTLSELTYTCDCDDVKNYEGDTCNVPMTVCKSTSVDCKEYKDENGILQPAYICPPDEMFDGDHCETVEKDYDLAFPEEFAEKMEFVTSERGFYLGNSPNLTVSMWVAAADALSDTVVLLSLKKSSNATVPLLQITNKNVKFGTLDPIEFKSPTGSLTADEDFKWHFITVGWDSMGRYQITMDYVTVVKLGAKPKLMEPPEDEVVFVQLGYGFYGYISQVSVWESVLTVPDTQSLYSGGTGNKNLYLGWTLYSYNDLVWRTESSSAARGVSVCNINNTIAKMGLDSEECKNEQFDDKVPPELIGECKMSQVLPVDYSTHQISNGRLEYKFKINPDDTMFDEPEKEFYSYGAYDIAVASADEEGNIGVCMTRAYITPNKCGDTAPESFTASCSNNADGQQVQCPTSQYPSIPVPNYVVCGGLLSYNLKNMYEKPDRIVCGASKVRAVTISLTLVYGLEIMCRTDISGSVKDLVQLRLEDLGAEWSGLCEDSSCTNANLMESCGKTDMKTVIVKADITNVKESLTAKSSAQVLTPLELMKKSVEEEEPFQKDAEFYGATFQKTLAVIDTKFSCDSGFMLQDEIDLCVQCGAGSYYNETEMKCKLCELNSYTDQPGKTSCTVCAAGTVTLQRGSSSNLDCKTKCDPGSMLNKTTCEPCPKNFYQDKAGKDYCLPCRPASGTESTGSDSESDCKDFCKPGTELKGEDCIKCKRGFFRIGDTQDQCSPCPNATLTTKEEGSDSEKACIIPRCEPGTYVKEDDLSCQSCDYGQYQPDEAQFQCIKCAANFTTESKGSTSNSSCLFVCPPGQEENPPNSQQCTLCKRGFFRSDELGQRFENCTMCPADNTTMKAGSMSLSDCIVPICRAGSYLNVTEKVCLPCPRNTYQDEELQESCKPCPGDQQTKLEGSNSTAMCEFVCPPGQEDDGSGSKCAPCPRGTSKEGVFGTCQNCSNGKTTDATGAVNETFCSVPKCQAGEYVNGPTCDKCSKDTYQEMDMPLSSTQCQPCPAGRGTNMTGSTLESECTLFCEAGKGILNGVCTICEQGTWNNGDTSLRFEPCQECPTNYTTPSNGAVASSNCSLRDCGPGTFYDAKNNPDDCTPCDMGFYQPERLQSTCLKCPENTSTSEFGSMNKSDCTGFCPAGEEGTEASTCVSCPDDKFSPNASFGRCLACKNDYTSMPSDRTNCTETFCDIGRELVNGSCRNCQKGFYKDKRGLSACAKCPGNRTTEMEASSSVTSCSLTFCEAGFFSEDNKTCMACPVGSFKSERGNQVCTLCDSKLTTEGMGSTAKSDCKLRICDKGEFRNSSNDCQKCSLGFYQNMAGQTECFQCKENYTTSSTGAMDEDSCLIVCSPGEFRNDSSNMCMLCPLGTYQQSSGRNSCMECGDNLSTMETGSISIDACEITCNAGNYKKNKTTCAPCAKGSYQGMRDQDSCINCSVIKGYQYDTFYTGSTTETSCYPKCPEGMYLDKNSRTCQKCPIGTYNGLVNLDTNCTSCPGSNTTNQEGASDVSFCVYEKCGAGSYRRVRSTQCEPCPYGTYKNDSEGTTCTPCPSGDTTRFNGSTSSQIHCIPLCSNGEEYDLVNKHCNKCPIGQYKTDETKVCLYCPDGQTTLMRGSSSCTDSPPGLKDTHFKISVTVQFEVVTQFCSNAPFIKSTIVTTIVARAEAQNKRYPGFCTDRSCLNVNIDVSQVCAQSRKRATTDTGAVTVSNIDAALGEPLQRSSFRIAEELFQSPANLDNLADNGIEISSIISIVPKSSTRQFDPAKGLWAPFCSSPSYCGEHGNCTKDWQNNYYCKCTDDRYGGEKCDERLSQGDSNINLVAGLVGGIGGFLLLVLIIVGLCAYRIRKSRKQKSDKSMMSDNDFVDYKYPASEAVMFTNPALYGTEMMDYYATDPVYGPGATPRSNGSKGSRSASRTRDW